MIIQLYNKGKNYNIRSWSLKSSWGWGVQLQDHFLATVIVWTQLWQKFGEKWRKVFLNLPLKTHSWADVSGLVKKTMNIYIAELKIAEDSDIFSQVENIFYHASISMSPLTVARKWFIIRCFLHTSTHEYFFKKSKKQWLLKW